MRLVRNRMHLFKPIPEEFFLPSDLQIRTKKKFVHVRRLSLLKMYKVINACLMFALAQITVTR